MMFQGQITCKVCKKQFKAIDWLSNKQCAEPNCQAPEVQKLVQQAQSVIDKASDGNKVMTTIERGPVPHGFQAGKAQTVLTVPDVKLITVYPRKKK